MASMWPPKKNTAFTLCFTLYKNDGTVIANPGTLTRAVSVDLGAVDTTPVNAVTEEDTTYGQLSWVLDAAEMNGDVIWVYCVDDTAGCVPFTCTLYPTANTQDEIGTKIDTVDDYLDTELAAITAAVITNAAGTDIAADIIAIKGVVDTIQADTDLLDDAAGGLADIHTDLAGLITDIGANGAGLTAIPWNAAWDAEVQSECDDAITANAVILDLPTTAEFNARTLVAADYTIVSDLGTVQTGDVYAQLPANFIHLAITDTTGLVDITQTAADKAWGTATRVLTAGTNLSFSTHSAADVANLILVTPAQKIVTNAAGEVDANIQSINDAALTGNGTVGTPWGPA